MTDVNERQPKRRKLATTIYLTPEQDEQLRALSARTHVPVAAYVRQGIDLVLASIGGGS